MKEYINREAVIQGILNDSCELVFYTKENVIDYLESIPASDVAPVRHGKWLKNSHDDLYCSVCGATERDTYDAVIEECKYCYSCGARMNGKENNI